MTDKFQIPIGIIEGFFGPSWSWADRAGYAPFLADLGLDFYIYAPKDDHFLRKQWQQSWPQNTVGELTQLSEQYRAHGLSLGIGLSPFEAHLNDLAGDAATLAAKSRELNQVNPDIVCILFDDMRGDMPELAQRQARIVDIVCQASTASRFIVCPTYYSFDPLLEKIFGQAPANYLTDLGRFLDPRIDVFWTGPTVCSRTYPADHLAQATELLGRKPFLWDNYPVNDSEAMAPFLHIGPFEDRPARLTHELAGHAVNPMNQPWLSRPVIQSLAQSYQQGEHYRAAAAFEAICLQLGPVGELLARDRQLFEKQGLDKISAAQKLALSEQYSSVDHPAAREVCAWLDGAFAFDPACLT